MTDLNRRHLLAGAAVLGAAAVTKLGSTGANAALTRSQPSTMLALLSGNWHTSARNSTTSSRLKR